MRGDDSRNIDVPSKVKAFRADFAPDRAAIRTSYEFTEIAGVAAVIGHARVVLIPDEVLMSEASATRGLRAPKAGAQGMQDTRDTERAQTGAVGRALFLMGYGEKPDDSSEYESEEPVDWFKENGWKDQAEHDSFMEDAKLAVHELPSAEYRMDARAEWDERGLHWPLARPEMDAWARWLVHFARNAKEEAEAQQSDPPTGEERAVQPDDVEVDPDPTTAMRLPVEESVGPDAALVKRA